MLSHHLQGALNDLKDLIQITESDIADIKEAKNDQQFERLSLKEEKLKRVKERKISDVEVEKKGSLGHLRSGTTVAVLRELEIVFRVAFVELALDGLDGELSQFGVIGDSTAPGAPGLF